MCPRNPVVLDMSEERHVRMGKGTHHAMVTGGGAFTPEFPLTLPPCYIFAHICKKRVEYSLYLLTKILDILPQPPFNQY